MPALRCEDRADPGDRATGPGGWTTPRRGIDMAESTDTTHGSEEPGGLLPCTYCPQLGADVCVRITESSSGAGHSVYAHRACADSRGISVLYTVTAPTGRAS